MRKILLLDDFFPTGEQTIQPVLLYGPGRNRSDLTHITKTASEALDYIKNVTPEPGKTHLLLLALGSREAYGPNRNGDGFDENPVPARNGKGYYVAPGEELTKHYQSFETNPAHAFKHHVNKDPAKASGVVKKAFWNNRMHRVELLIVLDNEKDPEWVQRVNDGDFPPVSMGCRIKFDVCAICGNKAPTRAQYCDHAKFQMNSVLPDGKKVFVHNPSPSFFDISRVFRPADRTGYTLKKVAADECQSSASLGDIVDSLSDKGAAIRKLSDIDKIIRGEPIASASSSVDETTIRRFKDYAGKKLSSAPPFPMDVLLRHTPAEVLSTVTSLGMKLSSAEFIEFMSSKLAGRPLHIDQSLIKKAVAYQPLIFKLFVESPALVDDLIKTGALNESPEFIVPELQKLLQPYTVKRASMGELLYRRLVPEGIGLRPYEAPTTDTLSYADPASGREYTTTRGAAIDAQDAQTHADFRKMLGGGALLAGGYKLLTMHPSLRPWKVPLALGTGALGYHLLKPRNWSQYQTDQGLSVPRMTEFAAQTKESADSISSVTVGLIEDYAALNNKTAALNGQSAIDALIKNAYVDNIRGVELDLDTVARTVGQIICS